LVDSQWRYRGRAHLVERLASSLLPLDAKLATRIMTDLLKPAWPFVASAILIIAQALVWMALAVAIALDGGWFLTVFLLPAACSILLLQYSSIVWRKPWTAHFVAWVLAMLGWPWLSFAMVAMGISLKSGGNWPAIFVAAIVGGQLIVACMQNNAWAERLSAAQETGTLRSQRGYTVQDLLTMVTLAAIVLGMARWMAFFHPLMQFID
jgi:hypothetical protein